MRPTSTARGLLTGAALTAALVGCTILADRRVQQCTTNDQCSGSAMAAVFGATFEIVCRDNLCATGNPLPERPPPEVFPCVTNAECSAEAEASICVDNGCQALRKDGVCSVVLPRGEELAGKNLEPNAVVVAFYMRDPIGSYARNPVELAVRELSTKLTSPPLIALLCDKSPSKGNVTAVFDHLANLRVPVVVGQFERSDLVDVLEKAKGTNPRGHRIAVWSTLANDATVRTENDGLYRFLVDELANLKAGYQATIDRAVARAIVHGATSPLKAQLLVANTEEARALATALTTGDTLVDGVPLSDSTPRVNVESDYEFPATDYAPNVQALVDSKADVVVAIGGDEILGRVVIPAEQLMGLPKPVYVFSARQKLNYELLQNAAALPILPRFGSRTYGVDFAGDQEKLEKYFTAARTFGANPYVRSFDLFYDAAYVLGLSLVGAVQTTGGTDAGTRLTAEQLNAALDRVNGTSATKVDIDTFSSVGIDTLRSGGQVTFVGSTGEWRLEGGVRKSTGTSFYCFGTTGNGNPAPTLRYYENISGAVPGCAPP